MHGNGLDIGFRGAVKNSVPVLSSATGIDKNFPGYDGITLPLGNNSQDYVFSSHCLEHIDDYQRCIREWFRVLKPGGFLIIIVPHKDLYERVNQLPSKWNRDHKRLYTLASLLREVESSIERVPNSEFSLHNALPFRVRQAKDNDAGYDYNVRDDVHAGGCYEIELVLEKLR